MLISLSKVTSWPNLRQQPGAVTSPRPWQSEAVFLELYCWGHSTCTVTHLSLSASEASRYLVLVIWSRTAQRCATSLVISWKARPGWLCRNTSLWSPMNSMYPAHTQHKVTCHMSHTTWWSHSPTSPCLMAVGITYNLQHAGQQPPPHQGHQEDPPRVRGFFLFIYFLFIWQNHNCISICCFYFVVTLVFHNWLKQWQWRRRTTSSLALTQLNQ